MDEAAVGSDKFGQMREERDDIVFRHGFDLVNLGNIKHGCIALFPDGVCG